MLLDTPVAIRRAAMDLLARREHGRVELTHKLRRHGADEAMIDVELDRLTEEGLLSEARYLESFIGARARSGHGPLRIREELNQRGISRNDIEQALAVADIDWDEQLRDAWRRKFSGQRPADAREKAKQGRFLAYRGYSMDAISRLLSGRIDD